MNDPLPGCAAICRDAIVGLTFVLRSACGGGSGSSAPPSASPLTAAARKTIVACLA